MIHEDMNREKDSSGILIKQSRISMGLFLGCIILLTTVQWMTLDMYLPALPVLEKTFNASAAALNITLVTDLGGTAIGTLIGGTLSDKFGRKPIILWGILISGICQLVCCFSGGVFMMALFRGINGVGGGFALAVSSAIIKDSYEGDKFRKAMSLLQAVSVVGPLLAPAIGSFFITYLSWRYIFLFLGGATLITAIPIIISDETWPEEKRVVDSVLGATLELFDIMKDFSFVTFMSEVMAVGFPMWGYLSICSYILFDEFGVSSLEYAVLYSAGCGITMLAPFLYLIITRRLGDGNSTVICIVLVAVSTILLFTVGRMGPVLFMLAVLPTLITDGMSRSIGGVVLLDENAERAGAANAVYNFMQNLTGMLASELAAMAWSSYVTGLGVISAVCTVICIVLWVVIVKKKVYAETLAKPEKRS